MEVQDVLGGNVGHFFRFLVVLCLISFSFSQAFVIIPEINGLPGTTVNIPVMIQDGAELTALQLTLEYDPNIISVESDAWITRGPVFADHSLDVVREDGKVRVMVFSPSLQPLRMRSGLLFQFVARIDFGAGFGSRNEVTVSDSFACDSEGTPIGLSVQSGALNVNTQANNPLEGQNQLIFPHLANGSFSGGNFQATMLFMNQSDAPADVRLRFAASGNQPFSISFTDGTMSSAIDFSIPPRGSKLFRSDGKGNLGVGYARLDSTTPLAGTLLFQINQGGSPLTEVGIGNSGPVRNFEIPVLYKANAFDTGIALLNINSETVTVVLTAKEEDGDVLAVQTLDMTPHQHLAQFSTQFFATIDARDEFNGSIEVAAQLPISAIALKQTGLLLTSFPVAITE
jgi:hypothetical protein